ncbi:MAG: EI24 domain-containing protein [Luteibaculum sp.]
MPSFANQFILGIKSHSTAWKFIRKHGLWHYFVWPVLLAILILWMGASAISSATEYTIELIKAWIWDDPQKDGLWETVVYWCIWFIFKVLFFYTYFILNKYIVFIILSPILAIVSERVDSLESGKEFPFSLPQLMKDIFRGIAIALRNLFLEYAATLALLLLSAFIPLLAPIYPFAVFFIAAYFYGFAFLDYNCERYRLSYSESVQLIRKNMGLATGIGSVFSLLFFIPVLGGIIAPILSCVAASLAYGKVIRGGVVRN